MPMSHQIHDNMLRVAIPTYYVFRSIVSQSIIAYPLCFGHRSRLTRAGNTNQTDLALYF